ncbi:hypothetical protein [Ornithinimicrobium pekingense]|uniref:Glycosyltransferase family 1 protein n=1 Tax=Ornithinimicrobium pekingense TaxID=384677 RepID=A0ABQ2FCZ3_9MICO|nr:hypothetical protein [Ornithinimicrobium pekingense]GGK73607.1 hypothetical protein GCM10011509_22780 [Ornithinimicrobium pekingense]
MVPPDRSPAGPGHGAARDLVVAFAFAPFVDTAAVVAAKRVHETGRPVDLITNDMSSQRAVDPALDQIAGDLVRRRATLATPTWFSSWKAVERFTVEGQPQALAWDREGHGYERVYSRAHWVPSHVLAARFKVERPHVRWTAEFSDPLSVYVDATERHSPVAEGALLDALRRDVRAAGFPPPGDNLFEWVETLPYALADELLFTNAHQRDLMLSRICDEALAARARQRSVVRPHPTLPPSFYRLASPEAELEPRCRHIGYFGNFYASRGMSTVLTALAALPEELRARLRLHIYTGQQEDLRAGVAARGLQDVVRVRPFVGFLDFLALSARMDVLLINDAVTEGIFPANPYLPSKWSDYRGSGSRVWGVVEPGSTLSGQPLDHRSPVRHVSAALQVLAQIARG